MHVLVASTEGAGHIGPLLPLADAFARRGSSVEMLVPQGAEWHVEGRDRTITVTAGGRPPTGRMEELWARFAAATPTEQRRIAEREAFASRYTDAMLPAVADAVARRRPDLVLREPCEYASGVVAVRQGLKVATVGISFAASEWSVLDLVADILDRHGPAMREALGAAPFLTRFPAALDPSPFPRTLRYRDWVAERSAGPAGPEDGPLPDGSWPEGPGPRLYVTLGSRAGAMPGVASVFRSLVSAMDGVEARVLVTTGKDLDPALPGPVPGNVTVAPWVDQDQALDHCDAVICHGGSGTTYAALGRGIPVGFIPLFADQPANARAVARAGAGLVLAELADPPCRPDVQGLARLDSELAPAVRAMAEALLGDRSLREAARWIGSAMATQPSPDAVAATLAGWAAGGATPGREGG